MKREAGTHWPISILNGLSAMVALFLPMLMSRYLVADDIGRYKILFLYLMTVPALSLTGGIENGLYFWAGLGEEGKSKVRSGWSLTFAHSLIFFIIVIVTFPWLPQWFGWTMRESLAFAVASFSVALSTFYEALLIARNQIWKGAIFSSSFDTVKTMSILAAVLCFKTAESAVWAFAATSFLKIGVTLFFGAKDGWIPRWPDFSSARDVMKYSLPVSFSGIFDLLMNYSDRFLLSVIITPAQFAIYTFGCLSLPPLQIIERSVNKVLIPKLTLAIKNKDSEEACHLYREALEQIMMIYIPAVIGLFIFAEPIIHLLFTEKYIGAASFLRIYSIWYLFSAIPYDVAARASGDGKWILRTNIIMGIFSFLLCGLLTWLWGAYGALASLILSVAILRIRGLAMMLFQLSWTFKKMIPFRSLYFFLVLSLSLGIFSIAAKGMFKNDLWWFFICGGIFAIIYFMALFFIKKELFGLNKKTKNKNNNNFDDNNQGLGR